MLLLTIICRTTSFFFTRNFTTSGRKEGSTEAKSMNLVENCPLPLLSPLPLSLIREGRSPARAGRTKVRLGFQTIYRGGAYQVGAGAGKIKSLFFHIPYLVTHSSRCVSKHSSAQTLVPHFTHLTRPQYPHTSQKALFGYVSSTCPSASRYGNGGCASKLRNSLSVGTSGTRDISKISSSPGSGVGTSCWKDGGRIGGKSLVLSDAGMSLDAMVFSVDEEAASFFLGPERLFVVELASVRAWRAR